MIKNIFLIEDDEIFGYLISKIIKDTGQVENVMVFSNGQDALDHFKNPGEGVLVHPEIILMDLYLPVMDGWQFLEAYTQMFNHKTTNTHIYVLSSSISPYEISRAKGLPVVKDYIIKPVTLDKIKEIIQFYYTDNLVSWLP